MKACSACGYWKETNDKENISFHLFPKKENIRQEWIKAISKENFVPTATSVLCSQHFASDCFYYSVGGMKQRRYIKPGSIPTIFGTRFSRYEENNAIVKFENECLERNTTENQSNIDTEISCDNDTITINSEMEAENIYEKHPETPKRKLIRQRNPRYVGDCSLSDFQSPRKALRNWKIALSCIEAQRLKLATIQKQKCRLKKRVTHLEALIKNLKSKNLLSDDAAGVVSASMSESSKAIFNRLLNKKSRKEFPQILRTFATTLQFYSNRAYNYVRKTFMKSLPHPETIRRWYQKCDGTPGITKESIDTLKLKIREAKSKGKNLYFNLVIDEMCIKRKLDWDGKKYIGFIDLGTNIDTDELPEAQYALVFLVTCINAHYKIPIAYYFIHALTGEERANLLKQCLLVLHEANIHITSITVDGAASNIAMFNKMGANLTVQNLIPYFNHPVTKDKVFILLDACHMLKLVRNAFASAEILWDKDDGIIRWDYIKSLIHLQETEGLHAATKIRRRHLNWQREKMKVSIAAQVLSTSVANALTFCEQDLQMDKYSNSGATAKFCLQINNIFDLLNSRNRFCKNQSAQCITRQNYDEICKQVDSYCDYLQGLRNVDGPILKSNRKMGFFGFIVCMKSILEISKILFLDDNFIYLMTYKLSQDHLETFFSAMRNRGGFNNNPTAREFIAAYKRLLVHADVDISKYANNKIIDETEMLNISPTLLTTEGNINNLMFTEIQEQEFIEDKNDHDYLFHNTWFCSDYVQDVVGYIAGFIVKKVSRFIKCEICLSSLTCDKTLSYLQRRKCRGGLTSASENVVMTCLIAEKIFRTHNNLFSTKNIILKLIVKAMSAIPSNIFNNNAHLFEQSPLADHRSQLLRLILKKYFMLRLHHEASSKKDKIIRVRSTYTKLVLFKNQ